MGLSWGTGAGGSIPGPPPPPIADRRTLCALVVALAFGAVLVAFAAARPDRELPNCTCGCPARAHEHARPGTWCRHCRSWRGTGEVCDRYEPTRIPASADGGPVGEAAATAWLRDLGRFVLDPQDRRLSPALP